MKITAELHFIRKHILRELSMTEWARFRDLRPSNVDTNLYSYHLKQLCKEGYVERVTEQGYRLSPLGLRFLDHVTLQTFEPRWQPKVLTMIVAIHHEKILLWPKYKQPFINNWSLPSGKVHYEDASLRQAAMRELAYFTNKSNIELEHRGVIEFTARMGQDVVSHTLGHLFRADLAPGDITNDRTKWYDLDQIDTLELSPATREIITDYVQHETFFYAQYNIEWQ